MKLINADELLKHAKPGKTYGEMLVIGIGHIMDANQIFPPGIEETWRADAAVKGLHLLKMQNERLIKSLERISESESTGDLKKDCACMRAISRMAINSYKVSL